MDFLTVMGKETISLRGNTEIEWFAERMLDTLNFPKNVVKGEWKDKRWEELFEGLKGEIYELFEACMNLQLKKGEEANLRRSYRCSPLCDVYCR